MMSGFPNLSCLNLIKIISESWDILLVTLFSFPHQTEGKLGFYQDNYYCHYNAMRNQHFIAVTLFK